MVELLKHVVNQQAVDWLADSIAAAHPAFQRDAFVQGCMDGLDALELMPRGEHIADVMDRFLPHPFAAAAKVLAETFEPEVPATGENGVSVFRYLPHAIYVRKYGIGDFDAAMDFQYELTKRFTAEFSIRAFIERYPQETYSRLVTWAGDESVHVRRLVSEGTRPRLPWAARLRAYQADPSPVLALLELLKDDSARYVQRSVANSLNDIGKDHPALLVEVCERWLREAPEPRRWIVNHALRSLVKAGNTGALSLLGHGGTPELSVKNVRPEVKIVRTGNVFKFSCEVTNTGQDRQDLLIDFRVHFVKSNGKTSPKVFKLQKLSLLPRQSAPLRGSVSFRDLTTRKHYPGRHAIDLLVNGIPFPLLEFEVDRNEG